MDGSSTNGTTRNVTVIRATPAQTAILQKEYAISDMPASEKIKALSEQTTLWVTYLMLCPCQLLRRADYSSYNAPTW
jgi:hypothetical protein